MKKLFSFFLLLPFVVTSCSNIPGTTSFVSNGNNFETIYDDSYFFLDNNYFHEEIALASLGTAMATIDNDSDYSKHGEYLTSLWEKEGFENIYLNDIYKKKPTMDNIGLGFASKKINDFNLIAIGVRGGSYEAEWASDFTLGISGDAKGYGNSCDILMSELDNYITNNNISGHTKIWISGYSRAAAVSNLAAGRILQSINNNTFAFNITTSLKDVYAYCFATPLAVGSVSVEEASGDLYKPIHNIINFNDMFAMTLPHNVGFCRYGQNHYFPDRLTDIYFDYSERKKLVSDYHFMPNAHKYADYRVDDWKFYDPGEEFSKEKVLPRESIHPSLGRFANQLIHELFSFTVTRENYAEFFEESIRNTIGLFFGANPDIDHVPMRSSDMLMELIFSYSFIQNLFMKVQQKDFYGFASDFEYLFYIIFDVTDKNYDYIKNLYDTLFYFLLFEAIPLSSKEDLMLQLFSRDNLLQLTGTHATELIYSFVRTCDSRLSGKDACKYNDGTYQILYIENPTSISIYEHNLKKNVFTYKEGGKMESDTLAAEKFSDGSIKIYMPKNGSYEYRTKSSLVTLTYVDCYGVETLVKDSMPSEGIINYELYKYN